MKFKELLAMNEVTDKSAIRIFVEQLAVPLTTAAVIALFAWAGFITRETLIKESNTTNIINELSNHDGRIISNDMEIDTVRSKGLVHDSEIVNLNEEVDDLTVIVQRGFDQNRELLLQVLDRTP